MSRPHNIAGTEAFSPGPKVMISELPRRRAPLPLIFRWALGISMLGILVGLVDAAIGAPVGFAIVALAFLVAWLRG